MLTQGQRENECALAAICNYYEKDYETVRSALIARFGEWLGKGMKPWYEQSPVVNEAHRLICDLTGIQWSVLRAAFRSTYSRFMDSTGTIFIARGRAPKLYIPEGSGFLVIVRLGGKRLAHVVAFSKGAVSDSDAKDPITGIKGCLLNTLTFRIRYSGWRMNKIVRESGTTFLMGQ